ncbi:MAG: hypothetical protein ACYTFN_14800 [Planctomycetota bacterium]|jgi:hypothetical protein
MWGDDAAFAAVVAALLAVLWVLVIPSYAATVALAVTLLACYLALREPRS